MLEARRQFTVEFKREAVQLIEQQGHSVSEAGRRLDVNEQPVASLSGWSVSAVIPSRTRFAD